MNFSLNNKYELTLYSEEMTRFIISIREAVELIENSFEYSGYNLIPKLKSFLIKDVFEIYKQEFGLKYSIGIPRISEKIHELMASKEEIPRMRNKNNYYLMHYKNIFNEISFTNSEYSSKDCALTKNNLYNYLKSQNFFKNEI